MMSSTGSVIADLDFTQYEASKHLSQLAKHPYDLTKKGALSSERIDKFCTQAVGYKFLYGTERITEEVMVRLYELAKESHALEKMKKMQSGEVMNFIEGFPSENRSVLHTAARDFFDHPNQGTQAKKASKLCKDELDKLKEFMTKIDRDNRMTNLVMIGIGGSDLGPQAHYQALIAYLKPNRQVHFIANVDPDDTALKLKGVDLKTCLVAVVSKSGETLETQTNEEFVRSRFTEAGLKPEEHFIAITGEGSPMDVSDRYLERFHMWDWIGGRFSTSSVLGGVVLSFAYGFDRYWEFLQGANQMDKNALHSNPHQNLPLLGALIGIWNHNFLHYPTLAVIPYSQVLVRWAAHIQQVDMESNGKQIDQKGRPVQFQTGPIIWGEPGTNAQHSFFQLIHQGTAAIPMEMIGYKYSQFGEDFNFKGTTSQEKLLANLFAQSIALAVGAHDENPNKCFPGNRPSHLLLGEKLTPFSLGVLLSYFENKIAFQGFMWGINSFDQQGVQLGKVLANKIIDRFGAEKGTREKVEPYPLGDVFLKHLDSF